MTYHTPVLLKESIDGLAIQPDGVYADLTLGGGGHSAEILKNLKNGRLVAFDQDADAAKNCIDDERFLFVHHNYRYLKNFLKYHNAMPVDGILADLGVSSHHFDTAERGFSFMQNADLDMRMNQNSKFTAKEIVNDYTAEQLSNLLWQYGEIKSSRKIARLLVEARGGKRIESVDGLISAIQVALPKNQENKILAKIFQALRIEVNQEMDALKAMLRQTVEVLKPGGRLVIIAYHSLEDRLVKNFMRSGNFEGKIVKDWYGKPEVPFKLINKKVITPDEEELKRNPRSRSAKLRIAEKL